MPKVCLIAIFVAALGQAADMVKLRNGAQFEVERSEREADGVWLYSRNGIQLVPAGQVVSIEEILPPGTERKTAPAPPPAFAFRSTRPNPTQRMIDEAAWRHGLPPAIVHAVAQAESAYNQKAVSPVGAIGVMQLMPYTAAALGANPRDEAENIDAGTRYLREMLVKFQNHPDQVAMALAAYNAGPGAVQRYRGVPPYSETQTYVRRVIGKYEKMATVANAEPGLQSVSALQQAPLEAVPVPVPQVDRPTVSGLE
jgi:soluble lytic murein transglycosylase-like protein